MFPLNISKSDRCWTVKGESKCERPSYSFEFGRSFYEKLPDGREVKVKSE